MSSEREEPATAGPTPVRLTEHDYAPVTDELEALSRYGLPLSTVFRDFVDVALTMFTRDRSGLSEIYGRYEELSSKPDDDPAEHFQDAVEALLLAYNEVEHDVIGAIYEAELELENDQMGQYLTGQDVTTLMAELLSGPSPDQSGGDEGDGTAEESVHDPCCGSGRLLVSKALEAESPGENEYTGVDKSEIAAKMTVVNLAVLNVDGRVAHGDSLTVDHHQVWEIRSTPFHIGAVTHSKVE